MEGVCCVVSYQVITVPGVRSIGCVSALLYALVDDSQYPCAINCSCPQVFISYPPLGIVFATVINMAILPALHLYMTLLYSYSLLLLLWLSVWHSCCYCYRYGYHFGIVVATVITMVIIPALISI